MRETRRALPAKVLVRALPLLLALAFGLRVYNLEYHSLWFDEAMSAYWAQQPVARILDVTMKLEEDRLPPFYYLALHGWVRLAGASEAALRFPSVICGTLLVAVAYRLLRALRLGRAAALLAAALAALNPFLVWYAQEARMYAPAALWSLGATLLFVRALRASARRAWAYWAGYGLAALGGLYTHLYTGLALPAHLAWLLLFGPRSRRVLLPYALSMAAALLLFAPLALAAWGVGGEPGPGGGWPGITHRSWWLLTAFTTWKAGFSPAAVAALAGVFGLAALAGAALARRGPERRAAALFGLMWLAPLLLASLMYFRNRLVFYGERYFIILVAPLLALAALGALRLAGPYRRLAGALAAGLLVIALLPLPGVWQPPGRKEAWRQVAAYLEEHARAGDVILLHPDWVRYPFQHYYRGSAQTRAVFGSVTPETDLDGVLGTVTDGHSAFWLVETHSELADPERRVAQWLAGHYPKVTELYPPGFVAVEGFAPGFRSAAPPPEAAPLEAAFAAGPRLVAYFLPRQSFETQDDLFHPPSTWVHLSLYWRADAPLEQDYTSYVWLVDELGQVWGDSQALARPGEALRFYPTGRWQPGEVIRQDLDVNTNPLIPPGSYTLVVGLRDAAGQAVPTAAGPEQQPLTQVTFEAPR